MTNTNKSLSLLIKTINKYKQKHDTRLVYMRGNVEHCIWLITQQMTRKCGLIITNALLKH